MMRILYLTNGFPWPLTSGYLRHYFFLRELSRLHAITLVSLVDSSFSPDHAAQLEPFTENIITFTETTRRRSPLQKARHNALKVVRSDTPVARMRDTVKNLLQSGSYDAIFFSGKRTYGAIEGLPLPPMIADLCDATSMRIRLQMHYASQWRRPFLAFDYWQVRRIERKIIERAHALLLASVRDRDIVLDGMPGRDGAIIPNGVDTEFWQRTTDQLGQNVIIFTGAMNYAPNVDAALYLATEIFPKVRRLVPDAELFIVGHSPKPAVVEAGKQPGVTVTGFVPDVRPYLEKAAVFVAPLRFGAGIQNKLLEAMAMEVPTIGSPLAVAGLKTSDGLLPPVQVADTPDAYVDLIRQQFLANAECPEPHTDGRRYVETNFNWQSSGRKLIDMIDSLAGTT